MRQGCAYSQCWLNQVALFGWTTGWFKHENRNSFRVRCPRRFLEIDPDFFHVFNVPLPSLWRMIIFALFFFSPDIWVFVFLGHSGLKGSHISSEKKRKTKKPLRKDSAGAHWTRVQNFRVYLSKAVWTFGLLCGEVQKSRLGVVVTWF